jgi:RNA polymerase sigma-70 factor, ECF subfamily
MSHYRTDEQLWSEFAAGRRDALAALAQRYEQPLLGLACGVLGGQRDLACDAVQETWVRVLRYGGGFMGRCLFKTWVYRIAINQCRTLLGLRPPPPGLPTGDPPAADCTAPPDSALAAETGDALRQAVQQLDVDKRLVILTCYHNGLTHAEAAEILEIPLGTLKSRLHAALDELRAALSVEA